MNLKDRKKARRLLKELGCLTEFKRELKEYWNGEATFENIPKFLGGAFGFESTRLGHKYWSEKIMKNIESPFGWKNE